MSIRLGSDGIPATIRTLQLPADTVGELDTSGAPQTIERISDPVSIAAIVPSLYTAIHQDLARLGLADIVRENLPITKLKMQRMQIGSFREDEASYIHLEEPQRLVPGIFYLASSTLTTLAPEGTVHIGMQDRIANGEGTFPYFIHTEYDERSVDVITEPGKIARITTHDLHAYPYGKRALAFFEQSPEPQRRVFASVGYLVA